MSQNMRTTDPSAATVRLLATEPEGPSNSVDDMLEAMLDAAPSTASQQPASSELWLGEVVDEADPSARGRIRVRWSSPTGDRFDRWLSKLLRLAVRSGDRVLIARPGNSSEPIVTGVLDGFARRPEAARPGGPDLSLKGDEAVRINAESGVPLVEIYEDEHGPVVRLLSADVTLEAAGTMRLRARAVVIEATEGAARIEATDDVIVRGETIQLN